VETLCQSGFQPVLQHRVDEGRLHSIRRLDNEFGSNENLKQDQLIFVKVPERGAYEILIDLGLAGFV
jgi:hypothetical protein